MMYVGLIKYVNSSIHIFSIIYVASMEFSNVAYLSINQIIL